MIPLTLFIVHRYAQLTCNCVEVMKFALIAFIPSLLLLLVQIWSSYPVNRTSHQNDEVKYIYKGSIYSTETDYVHVKFTGFFEIINQLFAATCVFKGCKL